MTCIIRPAPGCKSSSHHHTYFMQRTFRDWMAQQSEVPQAMMLVQAIVQAGAMGISQQALRRAVRLDPETLSELRAALASRATLG